MLSATDGVVDLALAPLGRKEESSIWAFFPLFSLLLQVSRCVGPVLGTAPEVGVPPSKTGLMRRNFPFGVSWRRKKGVGGHKTIKDFYIKIIP